MGYGDKQKKIVFSASDKSHAELKIKLNYDGIKQGEFFRLLLEGYLEDNEDIINYISDWKERNNKQTKKQRTVIAKDYSEAKDTEEQFALNQDEVESIFDLLERESKV